MAGELFELEMLEERQLCSAAPCRLNSRGTLVVNGSRHGSEIDISRRKGHQTQFYVVKINAATYKFPVAQVHRIVVNEKSKHDHCTIHRPHGHHHHHDHTPVTIDTFAGDTLIYSDFDDSTPAAPTTQDSGSPGDYSSGDDSSPSTQPSDNVLPEDPDWNDEYNWVDTSSGSTDDWGWDDLWWGL